MKLYKLTYYILAFSFIWISCEDDKIAPTIQFDSPVENATFKVNEILKVEIIVADDNDLDFAEITLTSPDGSDMIRRKELSGTSATISEEFTLDFNSNGTLKVNIYVSDKAGNTKNVSRNFEYDYFESGSVNLNIKLQYNGEPLVMFNNYEYPDGKKIDFTRCSFYTSEMKLDEVDINEVEFHNFTNSHSTLEFSNLGYDWTINNVPTGTYSLLSFNIGLPAELNNRDPGTFPSGHPLAKPAENWFSWMSYIFLKVEGNVDLDDDDIVDTGIALHTGSNEALRKIELTIPIQVNVNENTNVNLVFDIYNLFNGTIRIFPIEENPQIHSLTQLDAVFELSNNLINSIENL